VEDARGRARHPLLVRDHEHAESSAGEIGELPDDPLARDDVEVAGRLVGEGTFGRAKSARAIATRCRSPPESRAGAAALSARPTSARACSARARMAAFPSRPSRRKTPGSMTFSSAESPCNRLKDWNTNPTARFRRSARASAERPASGTPATTASPPKSRSSAPAT
jgi:hypothetical protein